MSVEGTESSALTRRPTIIFKYNSQIDCVVISQRCWYNYLDKHTINNKCSSAEIGQAWTISRPLSLIWVQSVLSF